MKPQKKSGKLSSIKHSAGISKKLKAFAGENYGKYRVEKWCYE
jgi:hypothetical protein